VEVTLPTSQKGFYITVANTYGISGASQRGEAHTANERMLAAAGRRASACKNHPYFLMGDFNDNMKHSKVLTVLMEQQMLFDIAAEFTKPGQAVQKTFSRDGITEGMTGAGKTRIDFLLSNDVGIRVTDSFEYLFSETQGFDHLPMKLTLNIKAFTQNMTTLTKSAPINISAYDPKVHGDEEDDMERSLARQAEKFPRCNIRAKSRPRAQYLVCSNGRLLAYIVTNRED